jgi:metal-responsive CopG/Arc/MetJ family transcriptional regulator
MLRRAVKNAIAEVQWHQEKGKTHSSRYGICTRDSVGHQRSRAMRDQLADYINEDTDTHPIPELDYPRMRRNRHEEGATGSVSTHDEDG